MCWESSKQSLSYWMQLRVTWQTAGSVYVNGLSVLALELKSSCCQPLCVTHLLHVVFPGLLPGV